MNIINDIHYPCYIGTIPKDSVKGTEELDSYRVFYYDTGIIKYIYDALPIKDYNDCNCDLYYHERLESVRALSNFNRMLDLSDLPLNKCYNAAEVNEVIQEGLYEENDGFVIMSGEGQYNLGNMEPDMIWEIKR